MDFVTEWFWYLLAFVSGSALTWIAVVFLVKNSDDGEGGNEQ